MLPESKTCKSQSPLDRGIVPYEGDCSHQTCADCCSSVCMQLNTNSLSHRHRNPFGFFIAFITRFPVRTKLAPVKNDLIQEDGESLQRVMDSESNLVHNYSSHHDMNVLSTSHCYLYDLILIWEELMTLQWTPVREIRRKEMGNIRLC